MEYTRTYLVIQYFKHHFHYVYEKFHVQLTIKLYILLFIAGIIIYYLHKSSSQKSLKHFK